MGHNIGAAIGPIMGASVVMLSKNLVFIIAASTMLFYALLVFVLIQETMPKSTNKEGDTEKESGAVWKIVLRDKALMIYLLAGIIISMGFSQTEGMLPLHFDNEMKGILELTIHIHI